MSAGGFQRIGILGAGGWGTALAVWLAARGESVTLWGHRADHVKRLAADRVNEPYLPGVPLPAAIECTADLARLRGSDLVLFVTPSRAMRHVAGEFSKVELAPGALLLSCTKGIELGTGLRMSEILAERLAGRAASVAVLSGPSHAEEVSRGNPTAIVLGAESAEAAGRLQALFNQAALRAYTSSDVAGIELGGALKNIFAVAAGVGDGLGFGDNAKAALVTRALAELARLGGRLGGQRETFQGLSGAGDLMCTCFSRHSRNRQVGERLGRGESLDEITRTMQMVAEGVPTTRSAYEQARRLGVKTPIIDQVHAVLYEGRAPAEALRSLFTRDPRAESDG